MQKLLWFGFALFLQSTIGCKKDKAAEQPSDPIPARIIHNNIPYGNIHAAQKLDVYLPAAQPPYPVVLLIHGGGWLAGDKQEYSTSNKTQALLTRGYAVIAVNYRLSSVSKFPAQIQDVKAALRYIRANATLYGLNKDKVGAWGTSAGAHLSALLATTAGVNALEDFAISDPSQSSKIQAAIDWFGPTDFLKMDAQVLAQNCSPNNASHNQANSPESQLMGFAIQTQPSITATANPISYVTADDCPMYIQHGINDCTVPFAQSQILYDALQPLLGSEKVKFELLTASGHGTGKFEQLQYVNQMIDFLDRYLK